MSALEDLIVNNRETFHEGLLVARAQPRDEAATSKLKDPEDTSQLEKLAELAGVDPEDIVDVAVRGTNATFMVRDAEGAVSAGYFPLASLSGSSSRRRSSGKTGGVSSRTPTAPAPTGGAATVPTIVSAGGTPDAGEENIPTPPPEGVPSDIGEMSGKTVAGLLKDTPEGVDARAVLQHELARDGGPRVEVQRAAKTLGMLNDDGNLAEAPA